MCSQFMNLVESKLRKLPFAAKAALLLKSIHLYCMKEVLIDTEFNR